MVPRSHSGPKPESSVLLELMKAYVDTAKSFVQLSSAGLALPLVFSSQLLGLFGRTTSQSGAVTPLSEGVRIWVIASWACFLITIGAGTFYQYAAIKSAEEEIDPSGVYITKILRPLITTGPGLAYGVMVIFFYLGAVSVIVYSALVILRE
jgi:hypothetical protein